MRYAIGHLLISGMVACALPANGFAQQVAPQDVLPDEGLASPQPAQSARLPIVTPRSANPAAASQPVTEPIIEEFFADRAEEQAVLHWSVADAAALVALIGGIGREGLDPRDYHVAELKAAIASGEGDVLDIAAHERMVWLVEDLRDGRTPMTARRQWFAVDPDADIMPTREIIADALAAQDISGIVERLSPTIADYAALKDALALTPASNRKRIAMIRANMDRWRWLPRDLGERYLLTNVPEYQLRLTVNDKIIRSYRTVVGKPGRNATPQLAEMVEGIVFNPTWTVPQSIVKGEGLGVRVLNNPAWAKAQGYAATRGADGYINVVQQPGASNSLGIVKLDMPNEHAIFLHDTPAKQLFNAEMRAHSHGCIRVEDARTMAMTIAILGNMDTKADIQQISDEIIAIAASGEYTKYTLKHQIPVYITYFTMGRDVDGKLRAFTDVYDRDAPVLASFDQPREMNRSRYSEEEVVAIEAPGA